MARKKGKVVATFDYWNNGQFLTLEIRLIEKDGEISFQCTHDKPLIDITDKDANKLKSLVRAELDRTINIEWKNMLCIRWEGQPIECHSHHSYKDREIRFTVERWRVGNSNTGDVVHSEKIVQKGFDPPIHNGLPQLIRDEDGRHPSIKVGTAMIEDTPDNRLRISKIIAGFDVLMDEMAKLLNQDQIKITMTSVDNGGIKLLPVGEQVIEVAPPSRLSSKLEQ